MTHCNIFYYDEWHYTKPYHGIICFIDLRSRLSVLQGGWQSKTGFAGTYVRTWEVVFSLLNCNLFHFILFYLLFIVAVMSFIMVMIIMMILIANNDNTLSYSTSLYSTLLYSTLLYSTLLYSTLLYFTLLYLTLLYLTILHFTLLDSSIFLTSFSSHILSQSLKMIFILQYPIKGKPLSLVIFFTIWI